MPAFCRSVKTCSDRREDSDFAAPRCPTNLKQKARNMALIVHKYGGTSVGSPERIKNVAKRVAKARAEGHDIVVVVSAMSGETNRLVALAHEMQEHPDPRELDVVLATGEQVTIGLLAMALKDIGVDAKSYTGWQVALQTDTSHTKARIENIDDQRMRADLDAGKVVIVAGFQGISSEGNISTLGRGGSDTSAVDYEIGRASCRERV